MENKIILNFESKCRVRAFYQKSKRYDTHNRRCTITRGEKKTIPDRKNSPGSISIIYLQWTPPPLDSVETGIKQPIQAPKSAHPSFVCNQTKRNASSTSPFLTIYYTSLLLYPSKDYRLTFDNVSINGTSGEKRFYGNLCLEIFGAG